MSDLELLIMYLENNQRLQKYGKIFDNLPSYSTITIEIDGEEYIENAQSYYNEKIIDCYVHESYIVDKLLANGYYLIDRNFVYR